MKIFVSILAMLLLTTGYADEMKLEKNVLQQGNKPYMHVYIDIHGKMRNSYDDGYDYVVKYYKEWNYPSMIDFRAGFWGTGEGQQVNVGYFLEPKRSLITADSLTIIQTRSNNPYKIYHQNPNEVANLIGFLVTNSTNTLPKGSIVCVISNNKDINKRQYDGINYKNAKVFFGGLEEVDGFFGKSKKFTEKGVANVLNNATKYIIETKELNQEASNLLDQINCKIENEEIKIDNLSVLLSEPLLFYSDKGWKFDFYVNNQNEEITGKKEHIFPVAKGQNNIIKIILTSPFDYIVEYKWSIRMAVDKTEIDKLNSVADIAGVKLSYGMLYTDLAKAKKEINDKLRSRLLSGWISLEESLRELSKNNQNREFKNKIDHISKEIKSIKDNYTIDKDYTDIYMLIAANNKKKIEDTKKLLNEASGFLSKKVGIQKAFENFVKENSVDIAQNNVIQKIVADTSSSLKEGTITVEVLSQNMSKLTEWKKNLQSGVPTKAEKDNFNKRCQSLIDNIKKYSGESSTKLIADTTNLQEKIKTTENRNDFIIATQNFDKIHKNYLDTIDGKKWLQGQQKNIGFIFKKIDSLMAKANDNDKIILNKCKKDLLGLQKSLSESMINNVKQREIKENSIIEIRRVIDVLPVKNKLQRELETRKTKAENSTQDSKIKILKKLNEIEIDINSLDSTDDSKIMAKMEYVDELFLKEKPTLSVKVARLSPIINKNKVYTKFTYTSDQGIIANIIVLKPNPKLHYHLEVLVGKKKWATLKQVESSSLYKWSSIKIPQDSLRTFRLIEDGNNIEPVVDVIKIEVLSPSNIGVILFVIILIIVIIVCLGFFKMVGSLKIDDKTYKFTPFIKSHEICPDIFVCAKYKFPNKIKWGIENDSIEQLIVKHNNTSMTVNSKSTEDIKIKTSYDFEKNGKKIAFNITTKKEESNE